MDLLNESFENINEHVIQRLFDNQIQENKRLDYKRQLNITSNDDKRELIADLTSFANTEGGIIIFGIEEKKNEKGENTGLPEQVLSLNITNTDKFLQSLEDIIYNNTEPKLTSIQLKFVEFKNAQILVLGVSKSLSLPYMVTLNATNKFYKRKNTGKYLVDVFELSEIFLRNYKMKERAEQFRTTRITTVRNRSFIPNLDTNGSCFLHIIPVGYLDETQIDLSSSRNTEYLKANLSPMNSDGYNYRHNLEGFLTYTTYDNFVMDYAQLFRNGIIEYYTSQLHRTTNFEKRTLALNGYNFEKHCILKISQSFNLLHRLSIEPPYLVFVSLLDMKDVPIEGQNLLFTKRSDRSEILLPSVLFNSRTENVESKMKGVFDILWQSASYSKSPYYNDRGERVKD